MNSRDHSSNLIPITPPAGGGNPNYDTVRQAILEMKPIRAEYDGKERLMCPHVLGTKKGHANALLYQFGGESKSGLKPDGSPDNWRCVRIEKLSFVEIIDGEWHTAPNHSRPQTCVDDVDVEVTY